MAGKFKRGAVVYDKQGRDYTVESIDGGMVYCVSDSGVETEFPEAALTGEAEWNARNTGKRERLLDRLKASRLYAPPTPKLDRAASEQVLVKIEKLLPGIQTHAAVATARRVLAETGDQDLADEVTAAKCREAFDAAPPEARANLLAFVMGQPPAVLVGAGRLGDNLMRAMLDKFLEANPDFRGGARR